jgi:molybdopterin-guanine dinucleotide biosynthesis protein B
LLRLLAFLETPVAGEVRYREQPTVGREYDLRGEVTYFPQEPYLLKRTVRANVGYGLAIRGAPDIRERVDGALAQVGLDPARFAGRSWRQLSGGEVKRVALAARLALRPKVLLLDEPTANLDRDSADLVRRAVLGARERHGVTRRLSDRTDRGRGTCPGRTPPGNDRQPGGQAMKGVQILGFKKSGKTALCEALLAHLAGLGRKPCAVKCTHNPGLDKEDTDTDRFLPHCRTVGAIAGTESALFWNDPRKLSDLLALLEGDVLVMEGGREHAVTPRVLVLRDPAEAAQLSDPGLALGTYGDVRAPGLPHIESLAALAELVLARGFALPGLDCGACGRDGCAGLAADILAGRATPGDCATTTVNMILTVGGRPLAVNPFVERILASGIRGMLSELKGFGPGPIELRIG